MMTSVLRDSLGGNCMTTMIATLSLEKRNIDVRCFFFPEILVLSVCASLWDGVDGPGWVSVFSAGLGYAFRGKDAARVQSLGLCASSEIPPFENWVHIARDGLQETSYTCFGRPAYGLFTLARDLREETHQLLLTHSSPGCLDALETSPRCEPRRVPEPNARTPW